MLKLVVFASSVDRLSSLEPNVIPANDSTGDPPTVGIPRSI